MRRAVLAALTAATIALSAPLCARAEPLPPLRDGDIVLQTIRSSQTLAIMLASGTPYTHIGIVRIAGDGTPRVIEAVGPVREIPLRQWIGQGIGEAVTVMRMEALDPATAQRVIAAARSYLGRPYDPFFLFDDERIYCSELVYRAFEAAGIELGEVERAGDLHIDTPAARKLIARRWRAHPGCRAAGEGFAACRRRIAAQELVTPASIAEDDELTLIYSSFDPPQ